MVRLLEKTPLVHARFDREPPPGRRETQFDPATVLLRGGAFDPACEDHPVDEAAGVTAFGYEESAELAQRERFSRTQYQEHLGLGCG